jgi:hypothetical protein
MKGSHKIFIGDIPPRVAEKDIKYILWAYGFGSFKVKRSKNKGKMKSCNANVRFVKKDDQQRMLNQKKIPIILR